MGEVCGHRKSKACLGTYGPCAAVQSPEMAAYFRFSETSGVVTVAETPLLSL